MVVDLFRDTSLHRCVKFWYLFLDISLLQPILSRLSSLLIYLVIFLLLPPPPPSLYFLPHQIFLIRPIASSLSRSSLSSPSSRSRSSFFPLHIFLFFHIFFPHQIFKDLPSDFLLLPHHPRWPDLSSSPSSSTHYYHFSPVSIYTLYLGKKST